MSHLGPPDGHAESPDAAAERLRKRFARAGVFVVHLIGSSGAGKTSLLERTLASWPSGRGVAVLTGDIETEHDARRLEGFGHPVRQICTEGACHLDAEMVERALAGWSLDDIDVLFIENVGNLSCPSSFDLGERERVVVLAVTDGEDEPLKYPVTFARATVLVLTKIDLLPHVSFDTRAARDYARVMHPELRVLEVSCTTGAGLDAWMRWIEQTLPRERIGPAPEGGDR